MKERRITEHESRTLLNKYKVLEHKCVQEVAAIARHGCIDLLEVCTRPDSNLGEAVLQKGVTVERLGTHNSIDLSRAASYRQVVMGIKTKKPKRVVFATPCDPFSSIQNLNKGTPEARQKFDMKQMKGTKILKHCIALAELAWN